MPYHLATPQWSKDGSKGRSGRSGPQPQYGVGNGARTHDTRNHNPVLCQLSYTHRIDLSEFSGERPVPAKGGDDGTDQPQTNAPRVR